MAKGEGAGVLARLERVWLPRLEAGVLIASAVIMTFLIGFHITARWGGFSVRWTEEAARLIAIWATFFAVPLYLRQRRLLSVDFFINLLPVRLRALIQIAIYLVIAAVSCVLVVVGYQLAFVQWGQTSPGLTWPMTFFGLPIPIFAALVLVHLPFLIRDELRALISGEPVAETETPGGLA